MPAALSVNINKYALLRNSRGHAAPDLVKAVDVCLAAGAHGITVHPRMDQRHILFSDVPVIAKHLREKHPGIEFNIECENDPFLIDLVCDIQPEQCTLVPVTPGEVTSDHGFSFPDDREGIEPSISKIKERGIRVSLFADCVPEAVIDFFNVGTDRIELYTGPYAWAFGTPNQPHETARVLETAQAAADLGMLINAGHDLDRHNLKTIATIPNLVEVSIGHAQICRALEVGTTQSVQELLEAMRR